MAATASEAAGRVRTGAARNGGSSVKEVLTRKRPREAREVGQAAARMMRALARRAELGDLEGLAELRELERTLCIEQLRAAHALSTQHGYSWAQIGLRLGISKQSAHGRWGMR